jgi:hypothetical protein
MSEKKQKKIALGMTFFFHLIMIGLCCIFKFSYSAEQKNWDFGDFGDVIFVNFTSLEEVNNEIDKKEELDQKEEDEYLSEQEDFELNQVLDKKLSPELEALNIGDILSAKENADQNNPLSIEDKSDSNLSEKSIDNIEDVQVVGREKIRGGNPKYDCPTRNLPVVFTIDVTVDQTGKTIIKNITSNMIDTCLERCAESAAKNVQFEPISSFDDTPGTNGKIVYTFTPY